METPMTSISWYDIAPGDLKGITFENLTERFRGDGVSALVTHLENLNGTVIILLSPIGMAFGRPSMSDPLYWHGHANVEWGRNPEKNKAYARDIRRAGIKKASAQARLFGNFFRECGNPGGSVPSLSSGVEYLEFNRLDSYGFDKCHEAAARRYLERLFDQLGHFAFVPFPEEERTEDFFPGKYSFDFWLMVWTRPTFSLVEEDLSDAMADRVLAELKRSTARLESGLAFDVPETPICQAKRPVCVDCPSKSARPLTAEILSYRSRLVRLLGHPGYFRSVTIQLPKLREQWPELAAEKAFAYDPIHELESYLAEMLNRFPVLGEDLSRPTVQTTSPDMPNRHF